MTDLFDITRREFIRTSALVTASATLAPAAELATSTAIADANSQMHGPTAPVFPYGGVYFRKSNPPEEDWARDHQTAAQVGMNIFRHWFMWSAIEVAPGKYDWSDYDRMMDLAAKNGIRVILEEQVTCAPEWAFRKYPHARFMGSDGTVVKSAISGSSATGGFPGLCLDNPDVRAAAQTFLTALIEHYRGHPALFGYDLWNENTSFGGSPARMYCYCDASKQRLREWLRKYVEQGGTLVSEGLPGYFGDHGHVGTVQPNYGLDQVFGARESDVEFMPDLSDKLTLDLNGAQIYGRYFRQEYKLTGGTEAGKYANGMTAAVSNKFGQGKTLLIGSFPGAGYSLHHAPATKEMFAGLLDMAGIRATTKVSGASVQARLHRGAGGSYLWITNPTRDSVSASVELSSAAGDYSTAEDIWGDQKVQLDGRTTRVSIAGRDAAVIALR